MMKTERLTQEHGQRSELQDSSGEVQAWSRRLLEPTSDPQWQLLAAPYTPAQEGLVEAELALGNGSIGMRAVFPFATPGGQSQVYVAGLFGQPPGPVITPVLFSAPIWLYLNLTIDGEAVALETGELIQEERTLDSAARAADRNSGLARPPRARAAPENRSVGVTD